MGMKYQGQAPEVHRIGVIRQALAATRFNQYDVAGLLSMGTARLVFNIARDGICSIS
jgi:hypothetical protein